MSLQIMANPAPIAMPAIKFIFALIIEDKNIFRYFSGLKTVF
tara:strand:+ start:729 stop:854 length:126 start_codon:yes stop_codon:yes gene_type:complete